ncbi:MAG: DUF87 domain-containing protein [candidate division WOR-3 bacterium]
MKKAKITLMAIISLILLILWINNLANFPLFNKSGKGSIQSLQANAMIIANSMKNAIFIAILMVLIGFSLYKIYLYKTRIFGVISFDKLNRHLIILGATGVGKTTLCKKIIKKVMKRNNLPIYILDAHGEYDNLTTNNLFEKIFNKLLKKEEMKIEKITFDDRTTFNPFDPWNINPKRYIVFLTNTLKDILELSEPQTYILLRALEEEYKERKYFEKTKDIPIPPDINNIIERIQKLQPRSRFDYEVKVALEKLQLSQNVSLFFMKLLQCEVAEPSY